jgi:hypothetical protein
MKGRIHKRICIDPLRQLNETSLTARNFENWGCTAKFFLALRFNPPLGVPVQGADAIDPACEANDEGGERYVMRSARRKRANGGVIRRNRYQGWLTSPDTLLV